MHKLPEAWSPQETMQASIKLCEMCRIFLPPAQLQKRIQEMRKLWTKSFSIVQKLPHTQTTYTRQLQPKTTKTYTDIVTSSYNAVTDLQTTHTLPYLINVHGRLLFSEKISRVDALIRWWTLIIFLAKFQGGRLFQCGRLLISGKMQNAMQCFHTCIF